MAENGEKWRTSLAKALLRAEIEAGTVDENSDPKLVHESNPEYEKWEFKRFKPNLKNLIKAVRSGRAKPEKWAKSKAKQLLRQDIIDGKVTDDMNPEDVYNSRDEYKRFELQNFKTNFKNLKESVYTAYEAMGEDCEIYGHDIALLKIIRANDPPRKVPWHKSEAKLLLEKDIDDGKHVAIMDNGKKITPKELYQTRLQYREFSLAVFRDHIYQEVDRRAKKDVRFKKKKRRMKPPADIPFTSAPHRNQVDDVDSV